MPNRFYFNTDELKIIVFKYNLNNRDVYKWTNKIKNKFYIGSAQCCKFKKKIKELFYLLLKFCFYNKILKIP